MNVNAALEKLSCYSEMKRQKELSKMNEEERNYKALCAKIETLFDRIRDLYYIVDKTAELKIKNGQFFTDGIEHQVGFYVDSIVVGHLMCDNNACYKPSVKFGVRGGGYDGGDIEVNPFENTIKYSKPNEHLSFNSVNKLKKIIKDFDTYEKKVYDFVENLK